MTQFGLNLLRTRIAAGERTRCSPTVFSRRLAKVLAAAAIATVMGRADRAQATTFYEGFESFTGASGSTVAGYAGWTTSGYVSSNGGAVVEENDGTAYSGNNYLRLIDPDGSSIGGARDAISTTVLANGATISFALRDDPDGSGYNNDQFKLYAGSVPALQCGIQSNGSAAFFSTTSYSAGTGSSGSSSAAGTAVANTWYLFSISYSVNQTTFAGTYNLTITSPTGATIEAYSGLAGQANLGSGVASFSAIVMATNTTYVGNADLDAITISNPAPEPASIAGMGMLGVALLRRRRSAIRSLDAARS